MDARRQADLAAAFAARHHEGPILVLPNAFDVATARLIARHGPPAIGTTSAAMAVAHGVPDGERIDRKTMLAAIERIVAAVDIGVTADVEAGYGDEADDAEAVAARLLEAGAIGMNLQDTGHPDGRWAEGLIPIDRACAKIAAVRAAADRAGVSLVINARTDTFLEPRDPVEHAIERGTAYLAAGADCVFAPGVADRDGIERLAAGVPGPVNVYAGPGVPRTSDLEAMGVRRVSVGCGPYQACLALVDRITSELLDEGSYDAFTAHQLSLQEMSALVAGPG